MAASERVVVLDNGGATLKVGFAGEENPRKEMPNCIVRGKGAKKQYIADQVNACDDIQSLTFRRPFDRVSLRLYRMGALHPLHSL